MVSQEAQATVLVADDDQRVREHFQRLLRDNGYEVILAVDGREALSHVRQFHPDLVMLDVVMPGLDGLEVCRILKARQNTGFLPVIIVTSKDDMQSRVEGLRLGADDYLTKPTDTTELLARIEALLRIKALQDRIAKTTSKAKSTDKVDELTGLFNAAYLEERLADEFQRAERYSEPLSCILIQIDEMESLRKNHGPEARDGFLKDMGAILGQGVREFDLVVRANEFQFMILLPRTHFTGSLAVATRLWRAVQDHNFSVGERRIPLSASMGVAFFPNKDVTSHQHMFEQARQALEKARQTGGGQICLYQHTTYFYRPDMGR